METLTSCRMDPKPRSTFFVARKSRPKLSAIFLTSSGFPDTGSKAISTNGMPSLSKLYSLTSVVSDRSFAASSSKQMLCTPIFSPSTSR